LYTGQIALRWLHVVWGQLGALSGQVFGHGAAPTTKEQVTAMTKIQIDQPDQDEAASHLGSLLVPLFRWHGKDFYPMFGAEGDGDDDGDGDGDPGSDDGDDDGEGDGKEGSGDAKPVTREEFDRLRTQLSMSDKKRSAAEKALKAIEDGKKGELQKVQDDLAEANKKNEMQATELATMRLQNAFLSADVGITWHDPADALALAERRGYLEGVVEEDGKVDEKMLATKLKEMAKAKPNLVKNEADTASDGGKGEQQKPTPTGGKVGGKGKTNKDEPDLSRYDRLLNR
jgi:hypothetical protein